MILVWFGVRRHWGNFQFSKKKPELYRLLLNVSSMIRAEMSLGRFSVVETCPTGVCFLNDLLPPGMFFGFSCFSFPVIVVLMVSMCDLEVAES